MNISKSIILPIIGLLITVFFIGMSYLMNGILFNKLLVCGFILLVIFVARIREALNNQQLKNQSPIKANNY